LQCKFSRWTEYQSSNSNLQIIIKIPNEKSKEEDKSIKHEKKKKNSKYSSMKSKEAVEKEEEENQLMI
jgi:hypothetical protein